MFLCLVWVGGLSIAEDRMGFLRAMIWPLYLGNALADFATKQKIWGE